MHKRKENTSFRFSYRINNACYWFKINEVLMEHLFFFILLDKINSDFEGAKLNFEMMNEML